MKQYKGWQDVNLSTAKELDEISGDMITQDVKIVSVLYQMSEDEVWNKPLDEVNLLTSKIKWIYEEIPSDELTEITFDGITFKPSLNPNKMTFAQYVDLQGYIKDVRKYRGEIIATLFVPVNGSYGVGYDMDRFTEHIYETVSITQFKGFFLSSLDSLRTLIQTSMKQLKKRSRMIWEKMKTLLCGLGL